VIGAVAGGIVLIAAIVAGVVFKWKLLPRLPSYDVSDDAGPSEVEFVGDTLEGATTDATFYDGISQDQSYEGAVLLDGGGWSLGRPPGLFPLE
jgi:hypothetical protein